MPSLQRVPMLVCLLIELNIKLTDGPAKSGAVQVRTIKGVAENQKSETGHAAMTLELGATLSRISCLV